MAESVSAANEGKLTEAEATALSEAVNLGLSRDSRIARDGVISRHVESLLGARLSAREPDNEAESLRRWKAEANLVLDQWDQVWDALGKPGALGSSRALSSLAAVERIIAAKNRYRADRDEAWAELENHVCAPGVPTEAVRELAERLRELCDDRYVTFGTSFDGVCNWVKADDVRTLLSGVQQVAPCPACKHPVAEHIGRWCRVPTGAINASGQKLICCCEASDARALVQRAAETNPGPCRSDTEGGER